MENRCIIDCYQANCSYCNAWYNGCVARCNNSNAKPSFTPKPEPKDKANDSSGCEEIFRTMDTDRNGIVSKKEFIDFIEEQRKRPLPADGTLSLMQKAIMSIAGQNPEVVFNRYDTDHDGSISRKEAGLP